MGYKLVDFEGYRIGKLTVVARNGVSHHGHTLWNCSCDCGKECIKTSGYLKGRGASIPSCGCANQKRGGNNIIDIKGQRFGHLIVVKRGKLTNMGLTWLCKCDCDSLVEYKGIYLRRGAAVTCGCRMDRKTVRHKNHKGLIPKTLWNSITTGAKTRALSFEISEEQMYNLFVKQQGKCALSGENLELWGLDSTASLDRIDNALGYEPGNVQWVHKRLNIMRGTLTVEEFIYWCKKVADYNK